MEKNNNIVTVQSSLMPFSRTFTTASVENCKTVQDVVNLSVPFNFRDSKLVVTHNGKIIDCEYWEVTSVKEYDLVGLNFIPTGGGGGKNAVAMIGVIVAAVALPFAGAALAGAITGVGAAGFAGAMAAGVGTAALYAGVYGGVMVAGTMLLSVAQSALMSTPKQTKSNLSESTTSFIEGARNSADKYGVIPVNLGTNRIFPKLAATVYTETSSNNQYARQLFTYGYGKLLISDRKFGETSVDDFDEVEFEDKLNGDLNTGTKLYSNDVYQQDYNILLKKSDGYTTRTTQANTDEVEIDITFQGLCKYKDNGSRVNNTVEFEIQYAPTGTENWSVGTLGKEFIDSQSLTLNLSKSYIAGKTSRVNGHYNVQPPKAINTFIILNTCNGVVNTVQTTSNVGSVSKPKLSSDEIILGYIKGPSSSNGALSYVDNHSNIVPKYLTSNSDFAVTTNLSNKSNVTVSVSGGYLNGVAGTLKVTASTAQSLRKSRRMKFPSTGQYDVRIKRLTNDTNDDKILDKAYLTAIKSISYVNPVNFADISGTAMRIKATDQLSGAIDSYNVIASTYLKGYDAANDTWVDDVISSNPADIFRYVLQSPAFAKALPDERIDLDKLAEWWVYCDSEKLTYDRVIDYDTSVDEILNDICAAGVATLSKVNNIYSVIIDNERPLIKGMVTPRNSWDYKGSIIYPDIPHALRVEFRNAEKGYETDERIVYADGYDENNAELYERLQFASCTDSELAYWYGRRYFATALLQPETHSFKMDFEHMTFNRGDRITLVNDVILVGVGQGRIKELIVNNVNNPTQVLGFKVDDDLNIPTGVTNLAVRIRDNNVSRGYTYHLLENVDGVTNQFVFETPITYSNRPAIGSLCAFVEDGKELDLIITGIKPSKDQSALITAVDYAPERFNPLVTIPDWNSNITISADFYKPQAPILLGEVRTDESVMIRNSDGSLTSVAVISLLNKNENDVMPYVKVNLLDSTEWFVPTMLKSDSNELVITGLEDGKFYNFDIRYQRQSGLQLMSDPLLINNVEFIGGSTVPGDVQNFTVTIRNGLGLFEWTPVDDIDASHYVLKYSSSTSSVTWENAQIVVDCVKGSTVTTVIHKGMYLIKAVDLLGYESANATTIICTDEGAYNNLDTQTIQDPDWSGTKTNVIATSGYIRLEDADVSTGYYEFSPQTINLGAVYDVSLSADVISDVDKRNKIRDIDYIRDVTEGIRNYGANINTSDDWYVKLEMRLHDGTSWGSWQPFKASQQRFKSVRFRLKLYSADIYTTPKVTRCRVYIDMPDRYESGENLTMASASAGGVVVYSNAFRNNPSVNITVQNGAVDDKIEYVSKTNEGFTFKVFNATTNGYVSRTFDYIAAGYGRKLE